MKSVCAYNQYYVLLFRMFKRFPISRIIIRNSQLLISWVQFMLILKNSGNFFAQNFKLPYLGEQSSLSLHCGHTFCSEFFHKYTKQNYLFPNLLSTFQCYGIIFGINLKKKKTMIISQQNLYNFTCTLFLYSLNYKRLIIFESVFLHGIKDVVSHCKT